MTRWILIVAFVFSGCALDHTRFVAPVWGGKIVAEPAKVQRDEAECGVFADERPSEMRYASYVACLVSRGHRTYTSLVGYGAATGATVQAERDQSTRQVFGDLTACAAQIGTRVDMPPGPEMFTGPAAAVVTNKAQAPFAQCMERAGYSTTLHATPTAVITAAALAPTPAPSPPPGGRAPAPVTPPSSPAPSAPQTAAPPSTIAAVPPPPAARAPRPVKLGLYVDPATSPPVVVVVASGTPAGQAGVRPGDVVLRIDGTSIRSEDDIATVLATKHPGDVVRMDVQRGRQQVTLEATLVAP